MWRGKQHFSEMTMTFLIVKPSSLNVIPPFQRDDDPLVASGQHWVCIEARGEDDQIWRLMLRRAVADPILMEADSKGHAVFETSLVVMPDRDRRSADFKA